jgi:hypothetical protein
MSGAYEKNRGQSGFRAKFRVYACEGISQAQPKHLLSDQFAISINEDELTWISIFQPRPTNLCVFFIDDMLYILAVLLDLICHLDTRKSRSYSQHFELSRRRILHIISHVLRVL